MFKIGDRVTCVNNDTVHSLTLNKSYIITHLKYDVVWIINDYEREDWYVFERFIPLKRIRKEKLNKLLKCNK